MGSQAIGMLQVHFRPYDRGCRTSTAINVDVEVKDLSLTVGDSGGLVSLAWEISDAQKDVMAKASALRSKIAELQAELEALEPP